MRVQRFSKYSKYLITKISSILFTFLSMLSPFARGVLTGLTLSLATLSTLAYAASGGLFGDILAKILGITPAQVLTYTGNGTVANSARIGGLDATQFQRVLTNQTCPPGQCIRGYDASNNYTPICGN